MEKDATNGQDSLTNTTKNIRGFSRSFNEQPAGKVELVLKRWLDKQDVMKEFYVSERTLYNWRKKKLIPFGNIGRKFYYDRRLIEGLLNKGSTVVILLIAAHSLALLLTTQMQHKQGSTAQTIRINKAINNGNYLLEVTDGGENKVTLNVSK